MSNVLVVGGAGYVGGAVTDALMGTGHAFRVYDALLYESEYRKPIDFVRGDIRDHDTLQRHLDWADAVIWLAALVADGSCALYPELGIELNQQSVQWLADHFAGRIIFPSTCLVYAIHDCTLTEESPTDPKTVYTKTKLAAEGILAGRALVVRLSTLFGLGDAFSRPRLDLVTNLLTARAVAEKRMTVFGGNQHRPFLHVRDVAKLMVEHIATSTIGIYNVHAENRTILDLAKNIQSHIPDAYIERREAPVSETGDFRVSSDKARLELGFSPQYTIDDGIREIRELVASGGLKDVRHPRYSNEAFVRLHPLT